MKTVLLLLAALAAATGPAQAFQCHVCTSTSNCQKPVTCSMTDRYCKTTVKVETLSGNLVTKECAVSCTPSDTAQGQVSSGKATVSCCQESLCNSKLQSAAPPRSPPARTALCLALALGLLAFVVGPGL
ncbi:lymphocyte antigen 6D [Dasypus novemcinctus]|uniref:lymphocyte antigen 6D n=1 Tax=Dasypus novemcinctus TaxID=9361 RepID=UPI00265E8E01|nr:lymphocyte antigen 6D [Dasypus novemcinctus]